FTAGGGLSLAGTLDANGDVSIADTNIALDGASSTLTATGALTLTPGGAMILGATGQAATLQGTNTTITANGAGNDITLTSADDLLLNPGDDILSTMVAAGSITIDASSTANTTTTGVIDLNVNSGDVANIGLNIDLVQNNGATAARDAIAQNITLTANDADGDVCGIKIVGSDTAVETTGSYEAGISIDNASDQANSMTDAILITSSGVNNGVTDAIDASAANITNAINIGGNAIAGTNFSVSAAGAIVGITLDTGLGAHELYAMDQDVLQASSPTFAGATFNGNVDMTNDLILNIGDANTDFTAGGGLTLAGTLDANGDVSIADTNIALDGASTTLTATGALTLTPGGAMILGATSQAATLQGTNTSITANGAGNDISITSPDDVTINGGSAGSLINIGTNTDGNIFHI